MNRAPIARSNDVLKTLPIRITGTAVMIVPMSQIFRYDLIQAPSAALGTTRPAASLPNGKNKSLPSASFLKGATPVPSSQPTGKSHQPQ
jgi:hypothetical protein